MARIPIRKIVAIAVVDASAAMFRNADYVVINDVVENMGIIVGASQMIKVAAANQNTNFSIEYGVVDDVYICRIMPKVNTHRSCCINEVVDDAPGGADVYSLDVLASGRTDIMHYVANDIIVFPVI